MKPWRLALTLAGALVSALCVSAVAFADVRARLYSLALGDNAPAPTIQIARGLYYVGSSDIASYLIDTGQGLILIDPGYAQSASRLLATIRVLGYRMQDVRLVLTTHAHMDHVGGLARVLASTGAEAAAGSADAEIIEAGGRGDFFLGDWMTYPRARVTRRLRDGDVINLGRASITAIATPGHTRGCTSYAFRWMVDRVETPVLALCSLATLRYNLVNNARYPGIAADFRATFAKLRKVPCELFLSDHAKHFELADKARRYNPAVAQPNPFIDPAGCRAHIEGAAAAFEQRFAEQEAKASAKP